MLQLIFQLTNPSDRYKKEIRHIIRINGMIYDLEDQHIAFFKLDKSATIFI